MAPVGDMVLPLVCEYLHIISDVLKGIMFALWTGYRPSNFSKNDEAIYFQVNKEDDFIY